MKIKVAILTGGKSTEREVSIWSANEIMVHLDKEKYDVEMIDVPEGFGDNVWIQQIIGNPPDIVLSGLHGGLGENGAIQGLLECVGVPYVGSKIMASAMSMDKNMSKIVMRAAHIPVVDDVFLRRGDNPAHFEERIRELSYPVVVKPNCGGSSIGISIVQNDEELAQAVELVKSMGDDVLVEKYISGREVTCGLVETIEGLQVLTLLDISTKKQFFDYQDKYHDDYGQVDFSTLPDFLQTMIKEIAKKVFLCLNCTGYGRVDMLVREEQVYVLEMNTLPGLTSHSLIPKAAKGADMSYSAFLDLLIAYELNTAQYKKGFE